MSTWQLPPPCTLVCSFCLQIFWELVIHFAVQWWEQMELKRFKPCLVIQLLCWFPRSCTEAFMREKYTSAIIWWPAATQNFPTKSLRKMPKYRSMQICWIPYNAVSTFADGEGKGALPMTMHLQESVLPIKTIMTSNLLTLFVSWVMLSS